MQRSLSVTIQRIYKGKLASTEQADKRWLIQFKRIRFFDN